MLEKSESDLAFVISKELLPTIEVDLDSIPNSFQGYDDIVSNLLISFALKNPTSRVTIYVMQTESVNFHEKTYSAFFGVSASSMAKQEQIINLLLCKFQEFTTIKAKNSDYIASSNAMCQYHIQNGTLWRPLEAFKWYALCDEDGNLEGISDDYTIECNKEIQLSNTRESYPTRFRKARSDASIGSIKSIIEEVFGLPEGSIALCDPSGKHLRSDASIATLRKRWG